MNEKKDKLKTAFAEFGLILSNFYLQKGLKEKIVKQREVSIKYDKIQ